MFTEVKVQILSHAFQVAYSQTAWLSQHANDARQSRAYMNSSNKLKLSTCVIPTCEKANDFIRNLYFWNIHPKEKLRKAWWWFHEIYSKLD